MKQQWRRYLLPLCFALGAASTVFGEDASYVTIDFPDAISTQVWGINPSGDVVGFYMSADKASHGFLRSGTHFTTIDYPGSALTLLNGINPAGDIVGEYALTATGPHHGFVRTKDGKFTAVDYPSSTSTSAIGINARGDIAGLYALADNINHGFLKSGDHFTSIDYPAATSTLVNGMNAQGDVVGGENMAGVSHGFLLSNGEFSSFHYPGAAFTTATGINPSGDIVGRYRDAAAVNHGFLLSRGEYTVLDFPGATFTGATAIAPNGDIVGRATLSGVNHGFLYTPERRDRHYTITDLGEVGAAPGQPFLIASNGLIGGARTAADGTSHAVLWYKGFRADLGPSAFGGPNSLVFGVNELGWAVGQADAAADPNGEDFCGFKALGLKTRGSSCLPFIWKDGVMTALPTLGGNNGQADQINSRGQVAGVAETAQPDPSCPGPQVLRFKPVLWENGKAQELPTFGTDPDGFAIAINQSGQAVGASGKCSEFQTTFLESVQPLHALLWDKGTAIDLGNLGGSGNFAGNISINMNNKGQVVGQSDLAGDMDFHGFLWTKETGMQDLDTLPGDFGSAGLAINDRTEVVGVSLDPDFNPRAFYWQKGVMTDLNALIPADSNLFLLLACSINSRGEIVGLAVDKKTGEPHGYLVTPRRGSVGSASAEPVEEGVSNPVVLSDEARRLVRQQLRLSRFGGRMAK